MKIILGVISGIDAQAAIDNIIEAGFDEKNISLVMADDQQARMILDDGGPVKGTRMINLLRSLTQLKIVNGEDYQKLLVKGNALLAIATPDESANAAKEMLSDYYAQLVTVVPV